MNNVIIFFLLLTVSLSYSQDNLDNTKAGDTVYYKKFRHVSKEIADEFVIVDSIIKLDSEINYAITAFPIADLDNFYSIRKYTTVTEHLEIISPNGLTTYYHKNGKRKSQGIKRRGRNVGKWHYWYDDEAKHMEVTYFDQKALKKSKPSMLLNFWDKTGKQTVTNGNGIYNYTTENDSTVHKGKVVDGERDGLWVGRYKNGDKYYDENYKNGRLIAGESWDKKGNHYTYTEEFVKPKFKRGEKGIRKIITKNFKIPKVAFDEKVEGTVLVSFDVDIDGSIVNVQAFRKVHPEVDAEAIRVIKLMKGWKPGVKKGKKVKTKFAIPITYRL